VQILLAIEPARNGWLTHKLREPQGFSNLFKHYDYQNHRY
jgi:hypothetical protein